MMRCRSSRGASTWTCGTQRASSLRLEVSSRNSRLPSRRSRICWLGCHIRSRMYVATWLAKSSRTFQERSAWLMPKAWLKNALWSNDAGDAKCSPVPVTERQRDRAKVWTRPAAGLRATRYQLPPRNLSYLFKPQRHRGTEEATDAEAKGPVVCLGLEQFAIGNAFNPMLQN